MFSEFKSKFGKKYSSVKEEVERMEIFHKTRTVTVPQRNMAESEIGGELVHGLTFFADLTKSECQSYMGYRSNVKSLDIKPATHAEIDSFHTKALAVPLKSVNWVGKYATPVKNQGICGSCWAFATTEQIESDAIRTLGMPISIQLAVQQVLSCTSVDNYGCQGGYTEAAMNYVKSVSGIGKQSDYPYLSGFPPALTGNCTFKQSDGYIKLLNYTSLNVYPQSSARDPIRLQVEKKYGRIRLVNWATVYLSWGR